MSKNQEIQNKNLEFSKNIERKQDIKENLITRWLILEDENVFRYKLNIKKEKYLKGICNFYLQVILSGIFMFIFQIKNETFELFW